MSPSRPPSRSEVENKFIEVLANSGNRDAVDRWAAQWVASDNAGVGDEHVWWALKILYGIDLRHGPDAPYLHDEQQVTGWLHEFRRRCASQEQ